MEYELWLLETGPNKIMVIKELRAMTGLSLKEAKDLSERKGIVLRHAHLAVVRAFVDQLTSAGARAEVRPTWDRIWYVYDPRGTTSQTFVRVAVGGGRIETTRMRFGEAGVATDEQLASRELAEKTAVLRILEERSRGFAVADDEWSIYLALAVRSPELEAAIASGDDSALMVYADLLIERGDARGELIARSIDGPTPDDLVAASLPALLGPARAFIPTIVLTWRCGLLESFDLQPTNATTAQDLVGRVLDLPVAIRVRRITIPVEAVRRLAERTLPPSLEAVAIRSSWWSSAGDPEAIAAVGRKVEILRIEGPARGVVLDSARLSKLELVAPTVEDISSFLEAAKLPRLRRLCLRVADAYGHEPDAPGADALRARFESLEELELEDLPIGIDVIEGSRLASTIRRLVLAGESLEEDDVARLIASRPRFEVLIRDPTLSKAVVKRLRSAGYEVTFARKREP
jgi:hypothetical protein